MLQYTTSIFYDSYKNRGLISENVRPAAIMEDSIQVQHFPRSLLKGRCDQYKPPILRTTNRNELIMTVGQLPGKEEKNKNNKKHSRDNVCVAIRKRREKNGDEENESRIIPDSVSQLLRFSNAFLPLTRNVMVFFFFIVGISGKKTSFK